MEPETSTMYAKRFPVASTPKNDAPPPPPPPRRSIRTFNASQTVQKKRGQNLKGEN
jgi:hypothetical protein